MPLKDVVAEIGKLSGSVLILTHHNADIDAITSAAGLAAGLRQLGVDVNIGVAESVSRAAQKLVETENVTIDPDCDNYDNIILVDTSVPEQLASVKNLRADIIIDHHPTGPLAKNAKATWVEPSAKSAAQMVFSVLKALECKIDKKLATILAVGIVADTAHLRFAGLPEFEAITELLQAGANYGEVLNMLSTPTDQSDVIAGLKAATRMQIWKVGGTVIVTSKLGSHEAPAARALQKLGADIAIVAAVKEEEVRISSRAKDNIEKYSIDLSEIFKEVGEIIGGTGGGHPTAGSANGSKPEKVDEAFDYIVKAIAKKIGKPLKKLD